MTIDTLVAAKALEKAGMENDRLNALGYNFRDELHKALWAFSLGIIGTITLVIGTVFCLALLLWPPG